MYTQLLLNVMSWAREAGAVHMRYFRSQALDIHTKLNENDVVTAADKAAERLLIDHIHAVYPDHSILSEESGEESHGVSGYRWVIDPLDGTTNFSQGLPVFCVSIAVEYNGEPVIGVVYAPRLDEFFHAVKGEGAWLNGEAISTGIKTRLEESVVATGFPVDRDRYPQDCNVDNVSRVLPCVRGLRRLGAAAVDLCYVAAGFLDGYWEMNLHPWDVAAGLLILQEAGGEYSHFRSDRNVSIVAANPEILPQLSKLIR